jgi:hypothetical protein
MLNNGRNRLLNGIISAAHAGPIGLEVFMALTALRWACYLMLPEGWLLNNTSATMKLMFALAPLGVWVLGFLLVGLGQGWAALTRRYRTRKLVAAMGVLLWSFIMYIDYTAGLTTATINLGTFVIAQIIAYVLLDIAYDPKEIP